MRDVATEGKLSLATGPQVCSEEPSAAGVGARPPCGERLGAPF